MSSIYSSPEIVHTVFQENTAKQAAGLWASRSDVRLTAVRFSDNAAGQSEYDWAGGMLADSCTVVLDRVVFLRNSASLAGAAVFYLSHTSAIDCTFEGNTGVHGGCVYSYPLTSLFPGTQTTFRNCAFSDNDGLLVGGALVLFDGMQDSLIQCSFTNNRANYGGALDLSTSAFFDSCLFDGNVARARGGVARSEGNSSTFRNCVFTRNASADSGGVIHAPYWSELDFESCTFANNRAPRGVVASVSPDPHSWLNLRNTIVSYCDSGEAILCTNPSVCADVSCCDFFANEGGDGVDWETALPETDRNFSANPLFCDTALGNYSLDAASPCLDAPGCGLVGARGQGCNVATSVASSSGTAPLRPFLAAIAPNPFNATATVRFGLPEAGDLLPTVHDTAGRLVKVLADGREEAGVFTATWDGRDEEHRAVPSGVYLLLLRAGSFSATAKAVLLR